MVTIVLGVILLVAIAIALLGFTLVWLVKSRYRGKGISGQPDIDAVITPSSKVDKCSRCGERRIIVSDSEGMCASCYSALRTKPL